MSLTDIIQKSIKGALIGTTLIISPLYGCKQEQYSVDGGVCCEDAGVSDGGIYNAGKPDGGIVEEIDAGNQDAGNLGDQNAGDPCLARSPPLLSFTTTIPYNTESIYKGLIEIPYMFNICSSTGDITRYLLDFDDGATSTLCEQNHSFVEGTYNIKLGVYDDICNRQNENIITATMTTPVQDKIIFISNRDRGTTGDPQEIYIMGADGMNQKRLTNNNANDGSPIGSGTKILFQSYRDGNAEIYTMDTGGLNQQRLTVSTSPDIYDSYDGSATWSPDGRKIVFISNRDGNPNNNSGDAQEIYTMDADGNSQTRLTYNNSEEHSPRWSPDGAKIAFVSNRDNSAEEIYIMNANGSSQTRLTNNIYSDLSPEWSPDGTKLAFFSYKDYQISEINSINVDGSSQAILASSPTWDDSRPVWSPDGTKIAFHSSANSIFEIYLMNANGANLNRLTNTGTYATGPAWSPDGTKIAFTSLDNGYSGIYIIDVDGNNLTKLSNENSPDSQPKWVPRR